MPAKKKLSAKKLAANRRNAKLSTGPQTEQGKARSRFNNLQHGAYAQTQVLPNEDPQELEYLRSALFDEFDPQLPSEHEMVLKFALAQWQMGRVQNALTAELLADPGCLDNLARVDRLSQIVSRLQRTADRPYKELDRLRTLRQKQAAQAAEKEKEKQAAQKEEEVPPEPEFHEGMMWRKSDGSDWEAAPPKLKHPDGRWEFLYPGDPRRKQYGWTFEPDRDHSIAWDPKTDPLRKDPPPTPETPTHKP